MALKPIPDAAKATYTYLGRSGLRVSNICLGAMTFGDSMFRFPTQSSEEYSHKILDRYVEWGGNFIDTADVYGPGHSERIIGTWLKRQRRDQIVLATKCRFAQDPRDPTRFGLSRRHIVASINESLERLQTDYVDLYQMHCWHAATPIEETLRTFDDLIRCRKIRYAGASNVKGWQLQKILDLQKQLNLNPFISLQQEYSLLKREGEFDAFEVCENEGVGVIPWGPLCGGFLSGKFKRDQKPAEKDSRMGFISEEKNKWPLFKAWEEWQKEEKTWALMDIIHKLAAKYDKSPAQISIRWLLQRKVVASVIIGATKLEHLDSNMGASTGWEISDEDMKELNSASYPRIPEAYKFYNAVNMERNPFYPQPTIELDTSMKIDTAK